MSCPPKALICGVSGQDGAYLAKLLLDKGYEVIGTSRDAQVASFSGLVKLGILERICVESVTLTDFRSVLTCLAKVRPDEIYNLAGQSSVGLSFQQPVETFESITLGVLNLLEAIRFMNRKVKFYNAGSGECFGNLRGEAATESSPFRPRSPYAMAKAAAYWTVANYREAYDLYACTGILFNHESSLRPERFVTRKIVAAACRIARGSKEKLKLGNLAISRDWGWAPEYVDAMWRMMQCERPEDFVIATGVLHRLEDFVEYAFKEVDLDWHDHVEIDSSLLRPTDLEGGSGNAGKAKSLLKWQPEVTFDRLIRLLVTEDMSSLKQT
ncbi:MAG: GDP-mannose 4,6-dehydratase [Candidatus Riflebacteria bacterium]|nr:GDP-mannose 4,6-dehydratase [Candidatus Riflebacteria bacterium]